MSICLSIIIPTLNRSGMLSDVLQSLLVGCVGVESRVECIVVDNGSVDDTRQVVEGFASLSPFLVRYVYEPCPGLHVGRNLGAHLARAELLAYLDDDVLVGAGWARAVIVRFLSDPKIALVGGACRPCWESDVPRWVDAFRRELHGGWYWAAFSLIDLGETPMAVASDCVFGCNFCVRKSVLIQAGGFHPDGMPSLLIRYRGDGEDAVAQYVAKQGLLIFYEPGASIIHRVPGVRMTRGYVLAVGRRSGVSLGYSEFRSVYGLGQCAVIRQAFRHVLFVFRSCFRVAFFSEVLWRERPYDLCMLVAQRAASMQFLRIFLSPTLRKWVVQGSYFKSDPCPYWRDGVG